MSSTGVGPIIVCPESGVQNVGFRYVIPPISTRLAPVSPHWLREWCYGARNTANGRSLRTIGRCSLRCKKVCQICATNPVEGDKIDFVDTSAILILCNLLRTQNEAENPAYKLTR
jgi:hypothetical protein